MDHDADEHAPARTVGRRGFIRLAGAAAIGLSAGAMLSGGDLRSPGANLPPQRRSPIPGLTPGARIVYSTHTTFAVEALMHRYLQAYPNERVDIVQLGPADAVQRVGDEYDHPVADVLIHAHATDLVTLANADKLRSHTSAEGDLIDSRYRDDRGRWYGIGLRPTVIVYNRTILDDAGVEPPSSVLGLTERTWFSNDLGPWEGTAVTGLPDPTLPSTAAWLASIYDGAGPEAGREFIASLQKAGAGIPGDDAALIEAISAQSYAIGPAEAPVALARMALGDNQLDIVYPEQGESELPGAWLSPTCVTLLRDSEPARQLMDFLISNEAGRLIVSEAFELPSRPGIETPRAFLLPGGALRTSPLAIGAAAAGAGVVREDIREIWGI